MTPEERLKEVQRMLEGFLEQRHMWFRQDTESLITAADTYGRGYQQYLEGRLIVTELDIRHIEYILRSMPSNM